LKIILLSVISIIISFLLVESSIQILHAQLPSAKIDSKQQQSINANGRIDFNSTSTVCINDKPCVTTICTNNQPCRTFTANSTNTGNSTNNPNSIILPPQQTF
jgi:hypothetical protein